MKLNSYTKKKYSNILKKIILNNNTFFFWNWKNTSNKNYITSLNDVGFKTLWLKRGVFSSMYLNQSNKILNNLLKNQVFFSYGNLKNENLHSFINNIDISLKNNNLIFFGLLLNHNLLITKNRFLLIKDILLKSNSNFEKIYLNFLQKFFIFFVLNRLILFKFFYFLNYQKNFVTI